MVPVTNMKYALVFLFLSPSPLYVEMDRNNKCEGGEKLVHALCSCVSDRSPYHFQSFQTSHVKWTHLKDCSLAILFCEIRKGLVGDDETNKQTSSQA